MEILFDLDEKKRELSVFLYKIVVGTKNALSAKYSLAEGSILSATEKEYFAYVQDDSVATPNIDNWARVNRRTKAEEILKIGIILKFMQSSANLQTIIRKKIQSALIEADTVVIFTVLVELAGFREKTEVVEAHDRLMRLLHGEV